ncbi:hypothetical protein B0H19DRAFT_1079712 [Mycena capillaripes]|nr:hypothetical protein B0H19DRAFT_1079712 [Mycena capillaripes]
MDFNVVLMLSSLASALTTFLPFQPQPANRSRGDVAPKPARNARPALVYDVSEKLARVRHRDSRSSAFAYPDLPDRRPEPNAEADADEEVVESPCARCIAQSRERDRERDVVGSDEASSALTDVNGSVLIEGKRSVLAYGNGGAFVNGTFDGKILVGAPDAFDSRAGQDRWGVMQASCMFFLPFSRVLHSFLLSSLASSLFYAHFI